MAIHILTGRPGTGKTYVLTDKAIQFADKGRPVYSNYKINHPKVKYYTKISELVDIKNGVILMDEAQIYFNSRNWEALDERLQYKLQQHRKQGLDIWGTVQNIKRLDVVMRELVSNYYECRFIGLPFLKFVWVREFDIKDAEKSDERRTSYSFEFHILDKRVYERYDTFAEIGKHEDDREGLITKVFKRCKECGRDRLVG